jgi:hypothetical protein
MIARSHPDRFIYLGDVYEHGSAADFERAYRPSYGRLARITAPTPGNHDWGAHANGYGPYWRKARGGSIPTHYSFKLGGWQLLSLNSEEPHGAGSAQLRWLRSRLRGGGTCRLAFWHRPLRSKGMHGDQKDVQPFWDALRGRATIVLNGHDHDMQRFDPRDGITQFVSGAGGHGLYQLGDDPALAFGNDTDFGALRLKLRGGVARYSFLSAKGKTLDSGSLACRP